MAGWLDGWMATNENNATQPAGAGAWLSLAKSIWFIRNRIDDLNQIICLIRLSGFCSRILTELFGSTE